MTGRVFATKVWGWGPERWAVLGFSRQGVRDSVSRQIQPGDLILFIGTSGDETLDEDKGRLLGLAEIDHRPVATEELVDPELWREMVAANGGTPKWPWGLPYVRAWSLDERPLERMFLPRLPPMAIHLASNIELLEPDEAEKVLALSKHEVSDQMYESAARAQARQNAQMRAALRNSGNDPTTGPLPTTGRRASDYRDRTAFLYVMRFHGKKVLPELLGKHLAFGEELFKIGWSYLPERRLLQINKSFPNLAAAGWRLHFRQALPDAKRAYRAEQFVLTLLRDKRMRGEFVLVDQASISSAVVTAATRFVLP